MDYDDIDFQSQNLQLVVEDNNKFPQSLQSFALPKFDIDEHLEVHHTFDRLAETEVLLDIQHQENNWIEDFSSRNSTIEFSSGATESCSFSRHNNVWSEATSSESVEMLLKSVGEDEMTNQQAINEETDAHMLNDSNNSPVMEPLPSDPSLVDKGQQQSEVLSESPKDGRSPMELDGGSLDEKFSSDGKGIAERCITDKKLTSSSDGANKELVVVDESLKVSQSDIPLNNSLMGSSDDDGSAANLPHKLSPISLACKTTQDDPSSASTDNASMGPGNLKTQSCSMEECHEIDISGKPEVVQSDNLQNAESQILLTDGKVNDKHFEVHSVNNDSCNLESFSCFEPSMSSMLLNEGLNSKSSDGLFQSIAYEVEVLNKDNVTGDKISIGAKDLPSLAVEKDGNIGTIESGNEVFAKLSHMTERSKDDSYVEPEYLGKDDSLHQSALSTKNFNFREERGTANFDAVISERQGLKGQLVTQMKPETRRTEVNDDNNLGVDPVMFTLKNSESDVMEKSAEGGEGKDTMDISKASLAASEHDILENSTISFSAEEVKIATVTIGKSTTESDKASLVAESNEANIIHLETPANVNKTRASSIDPCDSSSNEDFPLVTEKIKNDSSTTQSSGMLTDSLTEQSVLDKSGIKSTMTSSTIICESHSEVTRASGIVVEQKGLSSSSLTASVCNENDVDTSPLSAVNSNLDAQISDQPFRESDAVVKTLSSKKILDVSGTAKNDEPSTCSPADETSLATCQSTEQNKEANSTPADNCSRQNLCMETKCDDESHLLEPGSSNVNSFPPHSGSPAVISCNDHSLDEVKDHEGSRGSSDHAGSTDRMNNAKKSTFHDSKESNVSEDDQSITLEVGSLKQLAHRNISNDRKPFMHSHEQSQVSKQDSQGCHKELEEGTKHKTITKTTAENKKKQVSDRAKVGIPKVDAKEKPQPKHGKGREKNPCSPSPKADKTISSKTQMEILQQNTYTDNSNMRSSFPQTVQLSNLPDLNTSVSTAASFLQPFTDFQQVQLRAQIFVYGSLIQGIPPDEACMIAAFGEADGGRSLWEGAWQAAAERFQNHKSPLNNPETPFHPRAGALANEQGTRFTPQSKSLNSPASWSVSKAVISPLANPSPFWSVSFHDGLSSNTSRGMHLEFNSAASPMHSYQSSHIRQYANNAIPWLSQNPHPASSSFSSHSPCDASFQHSATQTVQPTPGRDSSLPCTSSMQLVLPVTLLPNQGSTSVTTTSFVMAETPKKTPKPTNKKSGGQKSRKTKKVSLPEELGTIPLVSQPQVEPAAAAVISKHLPTSASFNINLKSPINVAYSGLVSATSHPISPSCYQIIGSGDTQQRIIFSDETCSRMEESQLQAEEAAGHADAAVRHSQCVWSQLAMQRKSGVISEVEEKLASAAVAAAAASCVAKAAAEAAKVALKAALQAKMIVDEALNSVKIGSTAQNSDVQNNLARLSPASILKGKDKIHGTSSVISVAREAARMRVEAASAATKRAENLDAILKAAELATEAVSQAGTIIAMGDPLPFSMSELLEAGPDGYWKVNHATDSKHARADDVHHEQHMDPNVVDDHDKSAKQFNGQPSSNKERHRVSDVGETFPNNELSMHSGEKLRAAAGAGLEKTSVSAHADRLEGDPLSNIVQGGNIQQGSLVEILADKRGLRGVWFSAWVLDVKDDKAYVCYTDIRSDEGPVQLKEWIPLKCESDQVPRIRIAHPLTTAKYEATRKRRRQVAGNYAWAVGDRVDAWNRDGWWEGIITEKSQGDETKLTVQFPAGGDSQVVRAWDLRPSLVWKDGQWIMWSCTNERTNLGPNEGDTPHEKRQRLSRVEAANNSEDVVREVGTLSRYLHIEDSRKLKESATINLLAKDKIFSSGKNVEDVSADAVRVKRTGPQKEGSRVIFGVPRPGKKRKFMEVSKHYVSDKTGKDNEGNDSVKLAKYLMPQVSHPRRNTSKVDVKGKRATNSKPRGIKTSRSQNIQGTSTMEKNTFTITVDVLNGGESSLGSLPDLRASFSNEDSTEGKKSSLETGSFTNILGIADSQVIESSKQPVPGVLLSRNKSSTADDDRGKHFPVEDNPTDSEVKGSENPGKAAVDAVEPRRSNRRIQPTSRLLEGLQSSLIISKIPGVSHDKGAKILHRSLSSSRGQTHG